MWKRICEGALRVVTVISPVFLAACYGPGYYPPSDSVFHPTDVVDDGSQQVIRKGIVVDKVTGKGIVGIRVGCVTQGLEKPFAVTDAEGRFALALPDESLCTGFAFDDVDGQLNGGKYVSQILPWCECSEMTVEMTLAE